MLFFNILKTTLRNIKNDRWYMLINITGLSVTITCSLFILMYTIDEFTYDRYHKNAGQIYRVVTTIAEQDNSFTWAVAQIPLGDELIANYPEVENVVRFYDVGSGIFKKDENKFFEDKFYAADSSVFDMFSYDFLFGDAAKSLTRPNSIVLTETTASKYFKIVNNCVGETIQNQYGKLFTITGVIKDLPSNSSFTFDALISKSTLTAEALKTDWTIFGVYTYLQLPLNYNIKKMQSQLDDLVKRKVQQKFKKIGYTISYQLQPLTDIHLYSKVERDTQVGGDLSYIYILNIISVFLLIMACINYTNLATARSIKRSREAALRKIMGSSRWNIILHFLTESLIVILISLFFSVFIVGLTLPYFNEVTDKLILFSYVFSWKVLLGIGLITLILAFAGSSYPVIYVLKLDIVNGLKRNTAVGTSMSIRNLLVAVQFTVAMFMFISTFIVYKQMDYIEKKDLGFDRYNVIRLNITGFDLTQKVQALVENFKALSDVQNLGFSNSKPGGRMARFLYKVENNKGALVEKTINQIQVDYGFISTMGIKILKGRDFRKSSIFDFENSIIVNQSLVKRMNWTNPIGKTIQIGDKNMKVIGVINDYHQHSLFSPIESQVLTLGVDFQYIFIKTQNNNDLTLNSIKEVWGRVLPGSVFNYGYLDDDFNLLHKGYEKRKEVFALFTIITITITTLGFVSLMTFIINQRSKEIIIRRVLGADHFSLAMLMLMKFTAILAVSMILCFTLAWYYNYKWLQTFSYRLNMVDQWRVFPITAFIFLVLIFFIVLHQIFKNVSENPVSKLRNE